jgi:hypothetical protein
MTRAKRLEEARDALSVLDYLIHDLIVGHQLYDFFEGVSKHARVKAETEKAVRRMYVSYLVLTLSKLSEFLDRYRWLIPDDLKSRCNAVEQELRRRAIRNLRNTFIGHIHNKRARRPITDTEVNAAFNAAIDNDMEAFLRWIHESGHTASPNTVVGLLEAVHGVVRKLPSML